MENAPGIRSQELTTGLFYQNLTAIVVMTAWTTFIVYYVIWELSAPEGHKKALLADYMIMYDFMGVYYPTMKYPLDIGGLSQFMGNQIVNILSRWLLSWTSSDFGRMIIFMIPSLTFRWCLIDCIDKILPAMSWNPGHRSKQTQLVYNFQMILWKNKQFQFLVLWCWLMTCHCVQCILKLHQRTAGQPEAYGYGSSVLKREQRSASAPWIEISKMGIGPNFRTGGPCGRLWETVPYPTNWFCDWFRYQSMSNDFQLSDLSETRAWSDMILLEVLWVVNLHPSFILCWWSPMADQYVWWSSMTMQLLDYV